jgi:hypothetical protein
MWDIQLFNSSLVGNGKLIKATYEIITLGQLGRCEDAGMYIGVAL